MNLSLLVKEQGCLSVCSHSFAVSRGLSSFFSHVGFGCSGRHGSMLLRCLFSEKQVVSWQPSADTFFRTRFCTQFQCACGFSPTKQFSDTSGVSYSSTRFWHSLPGDSAILQMLRSRSHQTAFPPAPAPTSYTSSKSRLSSGYLINLLQLGEFPMTCSQVRLIC